MTSSGCKASRIEKPETEPSVKKPLWFWSENTQSLRVFLDAWIMQVPPPTPQMLYKLRSKLTEECDAATTLAALKHIG